MCDFEEIRDELRQSVRAFAPAGAGGTPHVNVFMFGPQGSGKSSFIRTCFRATRGGADLPPEIVQLEQTLHRTDDGTTAYDIYGLSPSIQLHDTRGQREFSAAEKEQAKLILEGHAAPGEVIRQRKRYWLLLREFWKDNDQMSRAFSRSVVRHGSLATEPHFVFLVLDPSQQELLLEDDDLKACYRELLGDLQKRGVPFAILCTHGDTLTAQMRQALHGIPKMLGLEGPDDVSATKASGGYVHASSFDAGPGATNGTSGPGYDQECASPPRPQGQDAPLPELMRIVTNYTRPARGSADDDAQQDIHTLLVLLDAVRQAEAYVESRQSPQMPQPNPRNQQECAVL